MEVDSEDTDSDSVDGEVARVGNASVRGPAEAARANGAPVIVPATRPDRNKGTGK